MVITGRYWNSNGSGIAIVAVVTEGIDWVAYIGADKGYSEKDCILWASDYGNKLSRKDAMYFFPGIELPYRY